MKDRWIVGRWITGQVNERVVEWMNRCMGGWNGGWTDGGWITGQVKERVLEYMGGWMGWGYMD